MPSPKFWGSMVLLSTARAVAATDLCSAFTSLSLANTTITGAFRQSAATIVLTPNSCISTLDLVTTADVCRVQGYVTTSSDSSVKFEAWLPDTWYGRFVGLGNGGLGGCYDWASLDYTTYLHFAAIGTNNGHDGSSAAPFLNHPEVLNDFAYRSIHVEAVLGKQLVEAYYQQQPSKSYYLGCSTGGRQAVQTAMLYPDDFDGFVGGSPAVNWNNLEGSGGILANYIDAPYMDPTKGYITADVWSLIYQETLNQCDALDGLVDGIISEPDDCNPDFQSLLCTSDLPILPCLNPAQFDAIQKIHSPINGSDGQELISRYDPGAEKDGAWAVLLSGQVSSFTADWFKYAVYNDTNYSFDNFSIANVEFGDAMDRGGISTWSGDLSAFRNRGGKFLTYHGRSDPLIISGNSKALYKRIASKLSLDTLDDFYRFFMIPGMSHCGGGSGSPYFGQGVGSADQTNTPNDTSHNILLALVDWVENGNAPDVIIGSSGNGTERTHCRYPNQSHWNGTGWVCVDTVLL